MAADFSQPQRQSNIGIVVMFFHTLQQYARALAPILVIFLVKADRFSSLALLAGFVGVVILIAVVAYLQYLNFTFYIDNGNEEFILTEGVFNKTKTVIQLDKIQQVNITQSLLQRIIGVFALDVDTVGSSQKEGKIRAVSHHLALALKARLLENEKQIVSDAIQNDSVEVTAEDKPYIKISFLSLLKAGITSNYIRTIGLLTAFFFTIYENVKNVAGEKFDSRVFDSYFEQQLALNSILILVVLSLFSILVINVIRVVFRYFNFNIMKQSGSLLLSFGLVNTKSTIIKPEKVQVVYVSRNYFQKKLDILELRIKQATSGEKEERKSAIEIPGCNESEGDAILKLLFKSIPKKGAMLKPNFRKLGFEIFLSIIVPLYVWYLLAVYVEPEFFEFSYLAVIYVVLRLLFLGFGFRNYRIFINDKFIIKQGGAWDIHNEIIEPKKIQAITTSQLFWHKSLNIGSLTLHTAGGNVSFQLGQFDKIARYVNLWLYEMETSDSNWM